MEYVHNMLLHMDIVVMGTGTNREELTVAVVPLLKKTIELFIVKILLPVVKTKD